MFLHMLEQWNSLRLIKTCVPNKLYESALLLLKTSLKRLIHVLNGAKIKLVCHLGFARYVYINT